MKILAHWKFISLTRIFWKELIRLLSLHYLTMLYQLLMLSGSLVTMPWRILRSQRWPPDMEGGPPAWGFSRVLTTPTIQD
jgi:hypothetical protein